MLKGSFRFFAPDACAKWNLCTNTWGFWVTYRKACGDSALLRVGARRRHELYEIETCEFAGSINHCHPMGGKPMAAAPWFTIRLATRKAASVVNAMEDSVLGQGQVTVTVTRVFE